MAKKQKDALTAAAETIGSTLGHMVSNIRKAVSPAKPTVKKAAKKAPVKRAAAKKAPVKSAGKKKSATKKRA